MDSVGRAVFESLYRRAVEVVPAHHECFDTVTATRRCCWILCGHVRIEDLGR
jgi:hypothetical protein